MDNLKIVSYVEKIMVPLASSQPNQWSREHMLRTDTKNQDKDALTVQG